MRARYAFVVLALLALALAGTSMLFTVNYVAANDRRFCQVITGFTATPVQRPADAAANPSRETSYEWYGRFVKLGRELGCS